MFQISMPEAVKNIINKIYECGYEAYIVGGCVRDSLLGREPYDFDITTSALPEDVKAMFERTVDTGIEHGTVTVVMDGKGYEVTTYRIDGEYRDMRHPQTVSYTSEIKEDLSRRDFTVNALAYNDKSGLVDVFGGIEDIEKKVIRCVRVPEERFSEDALRVLRAIRFSSVLDFSIEELTACAVHKFANRLNGISKERIFTEWKKLLSGKRAYDVIREYSDVIFEFLPELREMKLLEKERFDELLCDERQLVLFASFFGASEFTKAAENLKMDSKTKAIGISVLNNLTLSDEYEDNALKRFILFKDDEVSIKCARICYAIERISKVTKQRVEELIASDSVRRVSQLNVNGNDILSLGLRGENVGKTLSMLLYAVADGDVENEKQALLNYVMANL